jgi:hypothetical protein
MKNYQEIDTYDVFDMVHENILNGVWINSENHIVAEVWMLLEQIIERPVMNAIYWNVTYEIEWEVKNNMYFKYNDLQQYKDNF